MRCDCAGLNFETNLLAWLNRCATIPLMNHNLDTKMTLILAEFRQYLAALYGARLVDVVLFGSQARGDAVPGSDIDVLIVLKDRVSQFEEVERTGDFTSALCLKYDVLISRIFIAENDYLHSQMPFLLNVRREGIHV